MQPLTIKAMKLTGRRMGRISGRFPQDILISRKGIAKPALVPEGGLKQAPRTVWGHSAVEGSLKVASMLDFGAQTILGAFKAAQKQGAAGVIEMVAKMASKAIMQEWERELKRARIAAFEEGYQAGAAEAIARDRAARRAVEGANTIFPAAERAMAKQDYESGLELAKSLQEYHGTTTAAIQEHEDIPPQPVKSISGWVQAAGLVEGKLAIQFRGGEAGPVVCIYPAVGRNALEDLLAAPSAGKWVHSHVYRAAYATGAFNTVVGGVV